MRDVFHGYYRPSDEAFARWWQVGVFVPDANVLLSLYRASQETQNAMLGVLGKLEDRLWIPHQFALEFHENRLHVIYEGQATYRSLKKLLKETTEKASAHIEGLRGDSIIDAAGLSEAFTAGLSDLEKKLEAISSAHPLTLRSAIKHDPILDRVTSLFQSRTGHPYDESRRREAMAEAKRRIEMKVPPGYSDIGKGGNAVGDCIAWLQVLDWAKGHDLPVLLVTDDQKEDWYRREGSTVIGPRPELVTEMKDIADTDFYLYTTRNFLYYANRYLTANVSDQVIAEVQEASAFDQLERKRLERERAELMAELYDLRRRLVNLHTEREMWVRNIAERRATLSALREQQHDAHIRKEVFQARLKSLHRSSAEHSNEADMLQAELAKLQTQEAQLSAQAMSLEDSISEAEASRRGLLEVEQRIGELEHRSQVSEMMLSRLSSGERQS